MRVGLDQVVIDSRDPSSLCRFWAALLGARAVDRGHGWSQVEAPGWPRISFQPVDEGRAVKNRLHLDLSVDDLEVAADRVVALGGQRLGGVVTDEQGSFIVMADPEGNEFCVVTD